MDKVSVYCLDPLNFRCNYQSLVACAQKLICVAGEAQTSALLRDLQKMTASKPIS
jgi:hypothetical protein